MASVARSSVFYLLLHVALVTAVPVQSVPSFSLQRLYKRTEYEVGCSPALPEGPYPPNLNMREVGPRKRDGRIGMIGYDDHWGEREYLYSFTDICDRAGCHCEGSTVVCYNRGYILFVVQFFHWYLTDCLRDCECFQEDENVRVESSVAISNSSSESGSSASSVNNYGNIDLAALNAQIMKQVYSPVTVANAIENGRNVEHSSPVPIQTPNRLNHGKPCLAGQAAGWVFKSGARGECCPGYAFNALSASEAYVNYGLPISWIVAGVQTVGMCLKVTSG